MNSRAPRIQRFTIDDPTEWFQPGQQQIFLADVIDDTHEASSMSVGYAKYAAGESNPWNMAYDEILIILKGEFKVSSGEDTVTAGVGEVIFLPDGAEVLYQAVEATELVYVSHPHWFKATGDSPYAANLDQWQPV